MVSEVEVYRRQGFGNRIGFGRSFGLLIVDFVNGFNDPQTFGGGNIGAAIERTIGLLAACRDAGLPIAHTRVVYADDGSDHNVFVRKVPSVAVLTEAVAASQIVPELTPLPGELVVRKQLPSAFFGTNLAAWYTAAGVDTLFVAGCTTSGCVRASVTDAMASGFRPMLVTDCVGDRAREPHEANLFDMGQKCADLVSRDEVLEALARTLPSARQLTR
jgi:maleamate amidohydrolase